MPTQDLILRFERSCQNVSESTRYWSNIQLRVVEDKLMRQKAQLLLDEAASWSLLWFEDLIWVPIFPILEFGTIHNLFNTVHHLDFDAPTREHAHQLPDDKALSKLSYIIS
ncbi:hypothetical protein Pint_29202 [Pistacia integerrima]|uniref:Uncharacterized protein n=1 Tax=Pistacia integerrima TaxID=434235 RepID=A0ACC0X2K2_9ROSI|nr:hypothetical protein Pint_29202 [Pistacia integerrima]